MLVFHLIAIISDVIWSQGQFHTICVSCKAVVANHGFPPSPEGGAKDQIGCARAVLSLHRS